MTIMQLHLTEVEFVSREINLWGFEYVEDLYAEGYNPAYSEDTGWYWLRIEGSSLNPSTAKTVDGFATSCALDVHTRGPISLAS